MADWAWVARPEGALYPGTDTTIYASISSLSHAMLLQVSRYWSDEGGWFEAIVTDYKIEQGGHRLTYDVGKLAWLVTC